MNNLSIPRDFRINLTHVILSKVIGIHFPYPQFLNLKIVVIQLKTYFFLTILVKASWFGLSGSLKNLG